VLQHLAEQTADNANQMTATVNALQQKIAAQSDATSGKLDTASGQVQSLNDSVDELKSRIAKLDKSIQDLQAQLQNIQNPPPARGTAPDHRAGGVPGASRLSRAGLPGGQPGAAAQGDLPGRRARLQRRQVRRGRGEFQDVIHYYPLDDLAGTAQFYLGEIAYRQQKLPTR
jgi:TolA-binding protein